MNHPSEPDDPTLEGLLTDSRLLLQDAPESAIQRAIGVWRARPRTAATGGLRQLLATLRFDSLGLAATAAGLRSAGDDGVRQLLFSADDRDVDLRITPLQDGLHWRVSGQVLGPDDAGCTAVRCAGFEAESTWNELAEFGFDAVPAGACQLTLRGSDWSLALPPFDIPGSAAERGG
jgi:hypothetical protein